MNEFIFTWSIENIDRYDYSSYSSQEIMSPLFVADTLQNTAWILKLYLHFLPKAEILDDSFKLYLIRRKDDVPRDFSFNCEFSIMTANNLALKSIDSEPIVGEFGQDRAAIFENREMFLRKKALFWSQETLTLRCRIWKRGGDFDQFGQCFVRTRLEVERITSVADMNPRITRKKTFILHSREENKLLLFVNIFHETDGLKIDMQRSTVDSNISTFKFSAVGRNRTPLNYVESWCIMPMQVSRTLPFSAKDKKISIRNKLKLRCEFVYTTGEQTDTVERVRPCSFKFPEFSSSTILSCIPSGKLSDCPSFYRDLWDLYSKQILCDVELKTQTTSFPVHKVVLCARSPVFLAMFMSEMKEKTSNCVQIQDLGDDTLEKFIYFLYTDSFEESEWNAVAKLYYAADKYQVQRLKYYCRYFFVKNLDVSNACDLLILADRHSDSDLKSRVEYYIATHQDFILCSPAWKEFSEKHPLLALSAMRHKYDKERRIDIFGKRYTVPRFPNAAEDFRNFYRSQILSDIVIETTCVKFAVHKTMLCAGFSRLTKLLAKEKSPGFLEMKNLEAGTVSRLLLFLYTDSLGYINWEDAAKLYHAAVAYKIDRLKVKCSCFFLENLKASNAFVLLKLAHEHRDIRLKSIVKDFISLQDRQITLPEGWSDPPHRMETRLSKRLKLENSGCEI